jgi:exodeoxyribonuclease V alpha subunit
MIATHFAKFISQRHLPGHERFIPLVRELCEAVDNGSSCLDLRASADLAEEEWGSIFACGGEGSAVASPGASAPLILTPEGRLYLQRYYLHEQRIFEAVDARANAAADAVGEAVLESVRKLFGTVEGNDQAAAALSALQRRFTIISGGPGTGKTTTVLKILLLLKEQGHFDWILAKRDSPPKPRPSTARWATGTTVSNFCMTPLTPSTPVLSSSMRPRWSTSLSCPA